ncbi:hypothetical protein, partial [Streptococcus pneumoniae]|uniref:hypothetical protein n=1 Tax=Streptococcus pneumoniae TaxID=1313 RepID=UPI001E3D06BC
LPLIPTLPEAWKPFVHSLGALFQAGQAIYAHTVSPTGKSFFVHGVQSIVGGEIRSAGVGTTSGDLHNQNELKKE